MKNFAGIAGVGLVLLALGGRAQTVLPLGTDGESSITVYLPEKAARPTSAIVICPGGGYRRLCDTYEGRDLAKWLTARGVAGIVLRYHLAPKFHKEEMLSDGYGALKLVRAHAAEWNIDPKRVGAIGFSAGGHLASMLAVLPGTNRPDFVALVYPHASMTRGLGHEPMREAFIGPNYTDAEIDLYSAEKRVTAETPPAFLAHSRMDTTCPPEHSRLFVAAMKAAGRPVTYCELPHGPHGLTAGKGEVWLEWLSAFDQWLVASGLRPASVDQNVLVVHETKDVESWTVSPQGAWTKNGVFADCPKPMCAAFAHGLVYIGTDNGRIYKFTPEGNPRGLFAGTGARCDSLAVSPDGVWLYAASAFGGKANRIARFRLADGQGGAYITEGLSTPRTISFGADGCLYACNRGGFVGVYDVSGEKPVLRARMNCAGTMGGLLVDGTKLHLPFVRTLRVADLLTGKIESRAVEFANCFNAVKAGGIVWYANYDGRLVKNAGATLAAGPNVGACVSDLFNLTAAQEGTATRVDLAGKALDYQAVCTTDGAFKRLYYNNPGTTFLKAGLFSWPMIMDYDGDGDLDVVLHSGGIPTWNGTWFFENTGKKGDRDPIFKPARRVAKGGGDSAQILADGRLAVTGPGCVSFDYRENGMANAHAFAGLPSNVHSNAVRGNVWRFADLDGDGREDLVVGIGDWKAYGWHDQWDAAGVWKNEQIHGLFYFIHNETGADGVEKWAKPEILKLANGQPIDVYGYAAPLFADWDGDGDLDLLSCDFIDNYTYFENIGSKTAPAFAAGRPILDKFLRPIKAHLCMVTATVADWDDDGHPDFITCEEDARICIIRNTGRVAMGIPVFDEPYRLRQERAEVHFGILATPAVIDWDGDGDQDIITGNSAGMVAFIENLSGPKVAAPKWAEPKLLEADGAPIRIIAGPNGSIQGPCEEKWGYTCLSVGDWDGDGLPDVMLNSIRGEPHWCRNIGTRTAPKLAPPEPVAAEWKGEQPAQTWGWRKPFGSKNILTQWRTTPYMIDLDEDGLMDLVMLDVEGYLCLWRRAKKDGKLVLLPPERCLCDENGQPLILAGRNTEAGPKSNYAGGSGRRKFCFTDWTGDGKKDIVANSRNVMLYEFLKRENGKWYFKNRGDLDDAVLAGHTSCPTACDFDGDGNEELLVGAEDGFYYLLGK